MAFFSRRRFLTHVTSLAGVVTVARLEARPGPPKRLASRAAKAAQSGLDKFVIPSPPCTEADLTPSVAGAAGFKAGSPRRASFLEPGVTGTRIVVSGFVIGIKCGRVKDARLDFWQTDPRGAYDTQGFRFRGHQMTDAEGRYQLETVMPSPIAKRAPHLGARLTPPGQPPLTTVLFFPDEAKNGADPQFAPKLVMKRGSAFKPLSELPADVRAFRFDFILNL
jgi:protocatechuate 3,4-dioxygenase beta subunit